MLLLGAATGAAATEPGVDFAQAKRVALGEQSRDPVYAQRAGAIYDREANALVSKCVVAEHLAERKGAVSLDFVIAISALGTVTGVTGATDAPVYGCVRDRLSSIAFPPHASGPTALFVGVDIKVPKPIVLH